MRGKSIDSNLHFGSKGLISSSKELAYNGVRRVHFDGEKETSLLEYFIKKRSVRGGIPPKSKADKKPTQVIPVSENPEVSEELSESLLDEDEATMGRDDTEAGGKYTPQGVRRKESQQWITLPVDLGGSAQRGSNKPFIVSTYKEIRSTSDLEGLNVDKAFYESPMNTIPMYSYIAKEFEGTDDADISVQEYLSRLPYDQALAWVSIKDGKVVGAFGCAEDAQAWAGADADGAEFTGYAKFFLVKLVQGITREFVDDVRSVLGMLLSQRDYVSWRVDTENSTAVSVYHKYVLEQGGVEVPRGDEILYCVSRIPVILERFKEAVDRQGISASFTLLGAGIKKAKPDRVWASIFPGKLSVPKKGSNMRMSTTTSKSQQWITLPVDLGGSHSVQRGHSRPKRYEMVESATGWELLAKDDPTFIHRKEHLEATRAQGDPEIMRAYANTLEVRTKSENFKTNNKYYRQWVLLKDFKTVSSEKMLGLKGAVDYALNFCDVHVFCNCPSFKFYGFSYLATKTDYSYGLHREHRFPKIRNADLRGSLCKHLVLVLEYLNKSENKKKVISMFNQYYNALKKTPPDTMIAIPAKNYKQPEFDFSEPPGEVMEVDKAVALDEEKARLKELEPPEPEVISAQEPGTDIVYVDTKMAEGQLPPEQQVQYAGDEGPVEDGVVENVADEVSEDEVDALGDEILEADTGKPRNDNEKYVNEWAFQRHRREKDHGVSQILAAETSESLARKAYLASRKMPDSNLLSGNVGDNIYIARGGSRLPGTNYEFDDMRKLVGSKGPLVASPPLSKVSIELQPLPISYSSKWGNYYHKVVSSVEGMSAVKEAYGKKDIGFVSAFVRDPQKGKEDSKLLGEDILSAGFPLIRFLGHYENIDEVTGERRGGDEWSFGLINNGAGSQGFFQFLIGLGEKYEQHSVLLCPAKDMRVGHSALTGGHGYWFYLSRAVREEPEKYSPGSYEDKGILNTSSVEEWRETVNQKLLEKGKKGWSRATGTDEVFDLDGGDEEIKVWESFTYNIEAVCFDEIDRYFPGIHGRNMFPVRGSISKGEHPICANAKLFLGDSSRNDYPTLKGVRGFVYSASSVFPIPDSPAYWISPSGEVLPVNGNHIDEVADSLVSFGLTDEYVDETFQKYKEPKSFEGKARQEIMEGLIRRNWIRIRYIPRQDTYSIELNKLGKKVKDHLWAWAAGLLEDSSKRRYAGIRITEFAMDYYTYEFTLDELVKGVVYSKAELEAGVEESIVLIKSVCDMLSVAPVAKSRLS